MAAPSNIDSDKLLQLASALQTSLDVETLIEIFSRHLAPMVHHQGLQYANEQIGIDLTIGETGPRRSSFRLDLEEEALGELGVFSAETLSA
ncbi:MAG: hypothetical protein KAR22_15990, partial [Gammaproteobacteria bacterium]|nr:hypothetical protein [Gammaproteobacteria bacterium]